jgi:hypothetical protein
MGRRGKGYRIKERTKIGLRRLEQGVVTGLPRRYAPLPASTSARPLIVATR